MSAVALGMALLLEASASSAAPGWQLMEPMPTARSYHGGATVGNRWYVAGGAFLDGNSEQFPTELHVYNPTSGQWTVLGRLSQAREYLLAIADPSRGRILFPGGFLPAAPNGYLALATCDMATADGISSAPSLAGARHLHAAALVSDKFVVSGGWGMAGTASTLLNDAEVWDGASSRWIAAGRMPAGTRAGHTMTALKNGRDVLVVGGGRPDRALAEVDLFDISCGTWSAAAPLTVPRARHKALLLNDGRVLVAGGFTYPGTINDMKTSVELFDPISRSWKLAASMTDGRFDFDMLLLPDGRVLVAGGSNNAGNGEYGALNSAEVYDPATDTWTTLPPMHDRRRWPTLAVLSDGVYVAGGSFSLSTVPGSAMILASVERLAWSDLGVATPVDLDAGTADGTPVDASTSCDSDGGVSRDAATDGGALIDSALDGSEPHDATDAQLRDAPSSERDGAGQSGCSCSLEQQPGGSLAELALVSVILGAALRRSRIVPDATFRNC